MAQGSVQLVRQSLSPSRLYFRDELSSAGYGARVSEQTTETYSPQVMSSGDTRPERSGSSPYQKIQSSLAAVRESGGGAGEGAMPRSKMPAPGAEAAAVAAAAGPEVAGVAATRRHTHRMSPAKHREKLDSTGSSRGVPPKPPATSPHTSFLHLMPQRDVCQTISDD